MRAQWGQGTGSQCAHPGLISPGGGQPSKRGRCVRGEEPAPYMRRDNRGRESAAFQELTTSRCVCASATCAPSHCIGQLPVIVNGYTTTPRCPRPSVTERRPPAYVGNEEVLLASTAAGLLSSGSHAGFRRIAPGPGLWFLPSRQRLPAFAAKPFLGNAGDF
jgi:hypothetical protein